MGAGPPASDKKLRQKASGNACPQFLWCRDLLQWSLADISNAVALWSSQCGAHMCALEHEHSCTYRKQWSMEPLSKKEAAAVGKKGRWSGDAVNLPERLGIYDGHLGCIHECIWKALSQTIQRRPNGTLCQFLPPLHPQEKYT